MSIPLPSSKFTQKTAGIRIKKWEDKYIDYDGLKQFINDPRKLYIIFISLLFIYFLFFFRKWHKLFVNQKILF